MKDFRSFQLEKQLTFEKNINEYGGKFVYSRDHLKMASCLPTGERQASARLMQTAEKLEKMPFSLKYLDHSLAFHYLNGFSKWLSDIDENEKKGNPIHLVSLTVAKNTNSKSTTLRLCQSANQKHQSLCTEHCPCKSTKQGPKAEALGQPYDQQTGIKVDTQDVVSQCSSKISLNDCIPDYSQHLPPILELSMCQRTAMLCAGSDVSKYFQHIKQNTKSGMMNGAMLYRNSKTNFPTFEKYSNGAKNTKEILIFTTCGFGLKDLPAMSTCCGGKIVPTYAGYLESDKKLVAHALHLVQKAGMQGSWLEHHSTAEYKYLKAKSIEQVGSLYVDDFIQNISFQDVLQYLHCTGVDVTTCSNKDFSNAAMQIQERTAQFVILSMQFCGFTFKSFMSSTPSNEKLNALIQLCKPKQCNPPFSKPTYEQVVSEHIKKPKQKKCTVADPSSVRCTSTEKYKNAIQQCSVVGPTGVQASPEGSSAAHQTAEVAGDEKPYLQTLGMSFTNEYCAIRGGGLKLTEGNSKKRILCNSVPEFENWLKSINGNFSRKLCSMLLGQMYSQNSGLFYIFAVTVMKFLIGTCARRGRDAWEWTSCIVPELLYLVKVAVFFFFQTAKEKQVRCALNFSMDTLHILVSQTDAGQILHSNVCHIVQITKIGNKTTQNVQNLLNCCWLNKAQILSLPYHELNALTKGTQNALHIFQHLNKQGIFVDIKNVIILTDSATTLAQCTTEPAALESKFGHLVSRLTLMLMQMGGSPQENLFFFSQKNKKRPTNGEVFAPDLLTKCDLTLTEQELCEVFPVMWEESQKWLSRPPHTWSHITKFPPTTNQGKSEILHFSVYKKYTHHFVKERIVDLSPSREALIDPNIRSSNTKQINCLTAETGAEEGRVGGEGCFDKLLNRKYSKINTQKSAFGILSLVKWYFCKLKMLQKMPQTQKDLKITQMKHLLNLRREKKPFLPSCSTACGLDGGVGCGNDHAVFSDRLFSTVNTSPGWPLVGARTSVPVGEIFQNIKLQLNNLDWRWSRNHQNLLEEFIFCILAGHQKKTEKFQNLELKQIDVGLNNSMQLGVGRSQAICVGSKQFNLGRPVMRTLEKSCFAINILYLHHLKAGHVRSHAKASLLRHGFVSTHLEKHLKALEFKCGHCMKQKSISGSTKDNVHVTVNGNFFNLGQLCHHPNSHTITCDYFGFFYGKNDQKLWALLYLSHQTGMVYIDLMETLSLEGFLESFHCLLSTIGAVTCVLSDQGTQFGAVANIYEMNGEEKDGNTPIHRRIGNPLSRLLVNGDIEDNSGGISYRVVAAHSGEAAGQIERMVGLTKKALKGVNFFEKCQFYTTSKIRSLLNQATSTLNTRPMLKLDCGRILTPFDIISLTQLAGGAPFQSLQSHSDDKKIQGQIEDFENMKKCIQMEIFNKYIEHIFLDSGRRQKGNFSLDSKYLEIGDILLLSEEFEKTKNFAKSLRRISHLDAHKKHCVCYHTVVPQIGMDASTFESEYKTCNTKEQKQLLTKRYFGHYSFQSVDLRKTTLVTKRNGHANMDIFFKHSKNQWQGHPLTDADALDLQQLYNQLNTSPTVTSNTIMDINDEALEILSQTFLKKDESISVTTPKQEEGSCVQLDDTTRPTAGPEKDLLPKTRKGRIIKRPVRFGFDD